MATFSSVTRQHVLDALAEHDQRGAEDFLAAYGFEPDPAHRITHEGTTYDARAVIGVAHRFATGRLATPEEFGSSTDQAIAILRRRGFDVSAPTAAVRTPAAKAPRAPRAARTRTTTTRTPAPREAAPAICPTCSMTLPATGICDTCS